MPSKKLKTLTAIAIAAVLAIAGEARAAYDYVDISNPSLRKIPMAVSDFKTQPPDRAALGREGGELLEKNLDFTGYFSMIPEGRFPADPSAMGLTEAEIDFKIWTRAGAELLVTGLARVDSEIVELELRLFDTVKGSLLVGKRYRGWHKDMERMIRRFCGEIIHALTGEWGFFNSRIAFVSNGAGNKEIYTCDFDGANVRQVTHQKSIALFPAWSPDGRRLAYTAYGRGRPEIYIQPLDGRQGAIVSKKGINSTPVWVPGQSQMAATFSFDGDQDIYMFTEGGQITRRLTEQWGIDTSPAWSPDGSRMAFVSDRSGSPQIYIREMAGGIRRLTFSGGYNTQPAWSPRGDQIAYSSMEGGQINIYVTDLDGRRPRRLTAGGRSNESPSWSPDGSMIVFSSNREGPFRIYVMTAHGTDQRRLLSLPGEQTGPAWSPRMSETQQ